MPFFSAILSSLVHWSSWNKFIVNWLFITSHLMLAESCFRQHSPLLPPWIQIPRHTKQAHSRGVCTNAWLYTQVETQKQTRRAVLEWAFPYRAAHLHSYWRLATDSACLDLWWGEIKSSTCVWQTYKAQILWPSNTQSTLTKLAEVEGNASVKICAFCTEEN